MSEKGETHQTAGKHGSDERPSQSSGSARGAGIRCYGLAVVSSAAMGLLRLAAEPWLHGRVTFLTFLPAVLFTVLRCGLGPALLSVALGAVGGIALVHPRFPWTTHSFDNTLHLGLYLLSSLMIVVLGEAHRRVSERSVALARKDALERERSQLEAVFEAVTEGISVWDMQGNLILLNIALARINGYATPEEMRRDLAYFGSTYELLKDGRPLPVEQWPISRVLRGEAVIDWELQGRRRDTGREWWFRFSGEPVRDADGNQILAVITTRDITESKRAQQALAESEERFRTLADNMSQFAWMADETGSIFWYNRRWYDYTGTTFEEMRGWGWQQIHHPEHVERVTDKFRRHIESGEMWEDTFPLRSKDGTYRWFLSRALPIRDEQGRVIRWFGTNTDVTELRETAQALRESEQKFRVTFEQAAVGIALVSTEGRWLQVNRRLSDIVGYAQEELLERTFQDITHPDDLEYDLDHVAQMLRGERNDYTIEKRYLRKDSSEVWVNLTVALVRDHSGEPAYFIKVVQDIDARKRAEEEVRRLAFTLERRVEERTQQLQEANDELEAFAYSISHDLRAPLRAMQGFSDALREDYGDRLDETARDYIQRISQAAGMMDTLINDLLAYSRLSRADVQTYPVSLASVAEEALSQVAGDLREAHADVRVEGPLPDVLGHRGMLVQALANLVANAAKFVAEGVKPKISLAASAVDSPPGWVRLYVEDNGIGIAPEHRERIFRVFERLHGIEEYPGTGIGLAIVRKSLERMGGRSGVESEPGRGSRFWIELPGA